MNPLIPLPAPPLRHVNGLKTVSSVVAARNRQYGIAMRLTTSIAALVVSLLARRIRLPFQSLPLALERQLEVAGRAT